jgi:hypothetical protein
MGKQFTGSLLMQGEYVPDEFVPKLYMKFDELDDAYEFYCYYAKMAGFNVRKGRKSTQVSWFFCNKEGFWDKKNGEKKTEKGSMRVGCKVEVKFDTKGEY